MTDSTAERRALLDVLLDRVDRDALLPAERPLLRALVGAEQAAADTHPTTADDGILQRVTEALTAEHYRRSRERIVASPEEHSAAMARVALGALGGPVRLAFCSPLVNADCPGHLSPPYCDRAPSSLGTPSATPDWEQPDGPPRTLAAWTGATDDAPSEPQ